ncbi:MAG TPA: MBL fold metallo-hydrolase [Symbiobacteriaceae bacterium]|nr:MBL fold metallo-hydrolase [Symbiobacteriaceae bacterium]
MRHFRIEHPAPGVYAAMATQDGAAACNAGIIDLGGRTLVFDTSATLVAARELRALAEELTGRPPTLIINSHEHPDHYNGNLVFADGILIASEATREAMRRQGQTRAARMRRQFVEQAGDVRRKLAATTDPGARAALEAELREYEVFADGYPSDADFRLPGVTFAESMTFHGEDRSAQLIACGPSHSPCDAVLWLPAERVLFTGDLVVDGNLIVSLGTPELWPAVLSRLEALGADLLVPGHGRLVRAEAGFGQARAYLTELFRLAAEAAAAGERPEYAEHMPVPAGLHEYWFRENMRYLLRQRG